MNFTSLFSVDMACAVVSIAGSLLVACYDKWSYIGWLLWLISNVAWIGWALLGAASPVWGVVFQNTLFLYSSIKGFLSCRASLRPSMAPTPSSPATHSAGAAQAPATPAHHSA